MDGLFQSGKIKWIDLAQEMGYPSGESMRSQFRREKKKRGDPTMDEVKNSNNSNSGENVTSTPVPVYRETVEIKEDGKIHSDRLIQIESMDLRTPEKLLNAHGFDPEKWVLVNAINNYWNGMRPKDAGLVTLYQSKIIVKPKIQNDLSFEDINSFFENFVPKTFSPLSEIRQYQDGGLVLEIDLADAHVGNESLPFDELKQRIVNLITEVKSRCKGLLFEKIYLVQLGDVCHFDSYGRTTTSGTQVTYSSGFHEMFDNALDLMIWVINELSSISKLEVINIYGNHDKINSYTLAKTLEAYFRNNENVLIDATHEIRKFRKFGVSSVSFIHGDMPKSNIYSTFQKEARKLFGETLYSEQHLGHLHHEVSLEKDGVISRWLPSITIPDEWHKASGYTGAKQGTHCFVWNLQKGLSDIWMIPCGEKHL
jgi:hypothetical protein